MMRLHLRMPMALVALVLLLLLLAVLFGSTVLHAVHPAVWHGFAMDPDVINHSH